ncbi:MAG: hypothetical protein GYA58_03465 [Anaerolineaceae bacterium]|nr:hypothetical protein [Anaerolineaceae bacterium]
MKFGIRKPSLKKRIAARTSVKRVIRHNLGLKAPRGLGVITSPKKALYNRAYHRSTKSCLGIVMIVIASSTVIGWGNKLLMRIL